MNYKYFSGLLSLMYFVCQAQAWYWYKNGRDVMGRDLLEQELATSPSIFAGENVDELDDGFREGLCKDVCNNFKVSLEKIQLGEVTNLQVEVLFEGVEYTRTMRAFHCYSIKNVAYYLGKGPYRRQVAVYTFEHGCNGAAALGIMQY